MRVDDSPARNCDERNKMQISIQHQLHPPCSKTLHYPLVPQHMSEHILARLGHVQQRAILRVEMRNIQNEMREMGEEQRFLAGYASAIAPISYTID